MEYAAELMDQEVNLPAPIAEVESKQALIAVEQSRAMQEIQAALIIAKRFPRDTNAALVRITESCKRISLAEKACYRFPRGGETVTGPSIRLAEVIAQNYGNLQFGVQELERREGKSICRSFCYDLETNVRSEKVFEVYHEIQLKSGKRKKLTDPRDIYELVANNGARRLRACILAIVPPDITEDAVRACRETIAKGGGKPMVDRIREALIRFKDLGVSQEMLEERLGHKIDLTTGEELADLVAIYNAIKDKQAKRGDFFNFPDDEEDNSQKEQLKAKANKILAGSDAEAQ